MIDFVSLLGVCFVLNKLSGGHLKRYFIVPVVLAALHLVGNDMQEREVGPDWVQDHLHNVGIAAVYSYLIVFYLIFRGYIRRGSGEDSLPLAAATIRGLPVLHAALTLYCIALEVRDVTVRREEMMAKGYSGDLDVGDIVAYLIGWAIMAINYLVLRRSALRKPGRDGSSSPELVKS